MASLLSGANRLWLRRVLRWRMVRLLVLLLCLYNALEVLRIRHQMAVSERLSLASNASRTSKTTMTATTTATPERIYIASMHFNDGRLLRQHWIKAVLQLTEVLGGGDQVFVSVFESGSWDDSKYLLGELDRELERRRVPHRVETSDVTHRDEMNRANKGEGWVDTPRHRREPRRIPYLARLRNRTLQDLVDLHRRGVTFDKVLFLNDVVFTAQDVVTLLATNGGNYAAACSLDFAHPPLYYDTFALRDSDGRGHVMQTWPFFGSRASRKALVNGRDAVPVTSCWNGIVAMPAAPFVASLFDASPVDASPDGSVSQQQLRSNHALHTGPLRFRAVPDSLAAHHLEASECCLIHVDNPLSRTLGVYVNPRVRVGYSLAAYQATHARPDGPWLSAWQILRGLWLNRILRSTSFTLERLVVARRLRRWHKERPGNHEPGQLCLVNEMQVLAETGWAHV